MAPRARRTLIGGIGHRYQRDLAAGPLLVDRLRGAPWLAGADVEDLSSGPIALVQHWQASAYDRIVLLSAVPRDRTPGTVCRYCPTALLPDEAEIQARVADAVMGIVGLDNLLVLARHFGVLPRDVEVIEIEPEHTAWGEGVSAPVGAALEHVVELVRELVHGDAIEALRRREELLQVLFWFEGEGLGADIGVGDLTRFLDAGEAQVADDLETLGRHGYVEPAGAGRYRLTAIGRREGGRRFAEEFAPLLGQAHGLCNDPDCDCHATGDPAACRERSRT